MSTFTRFEEIEVWQQGRILIRMVRKISKSEQMRRDFALVDQLTRSARSVCANIAEGNDAHTRPDFIKFLSQAKKSAAEVRSHLYDALDENYVTKETFEAIAKQAEKVSGMLMRLIQYLRSAPKKAKQ